MTKNSIEVESGPERIKDMPAREKIFKVTPFPSFVC